MKVYYEAHFYNTNSFRSMHYYVVFVLTGAVVGVCACRPETQASLQQWVKELQLAHPQLIDATIVYDIRTHDSSSALLEDRKHTVAGTLGEPASSWMRVDLRMRCGSYKSGDDHVLFLFEAPPPWHCEVW